VNVDAYQRDQEAQRAMEGERMAEQARYQRATEEAYTLRGALKAAWGRIWGA
jgi:hypothetical protein